MDPKHKKSSFFTKLSLTYKKFYHLISYIFRLALSPLHSIHTLFDVIRLDLWIITGNEVSRGQKLAILYAGHEVNKNYLTYIAFRSSFQENYLGKRWLWKISKTALEDDHKCSLIVTEIYKPFRIFFKKNKCLCIPTWISGEKEIVSHITKESIRTE